MLRRTAVRGRDRGRHTRLIRRASTRSRRRGPARRLQRARTITAWTLLFGSLIGWPVSLFTVAAGEPPFVLSLSWLAIVIEAASLLTASQVHEGQHRDH